MQLMKTEVMTNKDGALLSQKKQRQSSHLKCIPKVSTTASLSLHRECLITMVSREGNKMLLPIGDTMGNASALLCTHVQRLQF